MSVVTACLPIQSKTDKQTNYESINRKKDNPMVAYCAEHSHSWLHLRSISHHATPGHGGKMDHYAIADYFRFLVMEGAFAAKKTEEGVVKGIVRQPVAKL
jgi:hypothetical protein